jgi:hypothetical protein
MAKQVAPAPSFNPAAKTLDFTSYNPAFEFRRLWAVINVTAGILIYAPTLTGLGGVETTSVLVTLTYNTAAMNSSDKLLVLYDTIDIGAAGDAAASSDTGAFSLIALFKRMLGKMPGTFLNGGSSALATGILSMGSDGSFARTLLTDGSGNVGTAGNAQSGFTPQPTSNPTGSLQGLKVDSSGNLLARSQILTDEGSVRDDFSAAITNTGTGTATFTNGSTIVTGSGTAFTTQVGYRNWVKLSSAAESAYAVVAQIVSDTQIILASPYTGTTGTGAFVYSTWATTTPVGGSITVASSVISLAPGTTNGNVVSILQAGDFAPFVYRSFVNISQRVASQVARIGFVDSIGSTGYQACFVFDGVSNTIVKCRTSSSAAASDLEEITVDLTTINLLYTTASYLMYEISVSSDDVNFIIGGVKVATLSTHIPAPYATLNVTATVANSGTVTATTLNIDFVSFINIDQLDVHTTPAGDYVNVAQGTPATLNTNAWPVKLVDLDGNDASFGGEGRLTTGQITLEFQDSMDLSSLDTNRWVETKSTMVSTQASGVLTLNSANTVAASTFDNIVSSKQFLISGDFPRYVEFKAKVIPQSSANVSFGLGIVSGTTNANDGAFFRFTGGGTLNCVVTYNTADTIATLTNVPNTTAFYSYEITILKDKVIFHISSADGKYDQRVKLLVPSTTATPFSVSHLPVFMRVFNNTGTPGGAQLIVGEVQVAQLDLATNKPWVDQLSGFSRSTMVDPATLAQASNWTNSTDVALATLSNTVPSYTTLGGFFKFNAIAGAFTDYALFAYQVPTGYSLCIKSIIISCYITGAVTSTATPTVLLWGLGTQSNAASLATGAPNPPMKKNLCTMSTIKAGGFAASQGEILENGNFVYTPPVADYVDSGRYVHLIVRIPQGLATANLVFRGSVTIIGVFELWQQYNSVIKSPSFFGLTFLKYASTRKGFSTSTLRIQTPMWCLHLMGLLPMNAFSTRQQSPQPSITLQTTRQIRMRQI